MAENEPIEEFDVTGTSYFTADVSDIVISNQGEVEENQTRKILRAHLVVNQNDNEASVQATLLHQRRGPNQTWSDAEPFNLRSLKAGQEVRLQLTAGQTKRLFDALATLYMADVGGWERGEKRRYTVVDADRSMVLEGREQEVIQALLEQEGEAFWEHIQELQPGLLDTISVRREHQRKLKAVEEFRRHMELDDWSEGEWEVFFRQNTWIFGQNLIYQFVTAVTDQPRYADPDVFGRDAQRGDVLLATEADARFTVLVDLKKPCTQLVGRVYRNQVYELGRDLTGGVAQMQSNARNWERKAETDRRTAQQLEEMKISTFTPRALLIIGNTTQLDSYDKRATFELFRRSLLTPEVITYDELLRRAEYTVNIRES